MGCFKLTYHKNLPGHFSVHGKNARSELLVQHHSCVKRNDLGNVLSIISDKVIPHANGTTVDYYLADVRQSSDYSPFGVQLSGRNFVKSGVTKDHRFGFQGQEEDDEIHPGSDPSNPSDGNSLNYTFRMHDPRLGRFFAIDPLIQDYPHQSSYQFSSNQPIHTFELEGAESNNELSINAGITANIGLNGSNTNLRGYLGVSGSVGTGNFQGTWSASLAIYSGGLGTTQGTRGSSGFFSEANFSAGANYGFNGQTSASSLTMNNYYQESGAKIENPFQNSLVAGINSTVTLTRPTIHFNDPRNRSQLTGYFGGKTGGFSFTNYNDLYTSAIIEDDSYWTGGMEAKYQFENNSILSFTYDCYTGKRPSKNSNQVRQTRTRAGQKYYGGAGQTRDLYNNGQTTLKFTNANNIFSIGLAHIGHGKKGNGQWQQNGIHKHYPPNGIPFFMNNSLESMMLNVSGNYGD